MHSITFRRLHLQAPRPTTQRGSTSFLAFLTMGTLASRPNDFTPSVTYCELCAQTQIIYSNMLDLELQASLRISTKSELSPLFLVALLQHQLTTMQYFRRAF